VWRDSAGLGWTNPYYNRVWDYNVDVAVAAARAGFDEIMFDYVRFPSDGDVASIVHRSRVRSRSEMRCPHSFAMRPAGSIATTFASRLRCSALQGLETSGSGSYPGAWRRTSTRCTP
jgi:hypothetical protein